MDKPGRSKLFNTKDYWCIAKNCFLLFNRSYSLPALRPVQLIITSFSILILYWIILYSAGGSGYNVAEYTIVGKIDNLILGKIICVRATQLILLGYLLQFPRIVHVIWGYLLGMIIYKIKDRKELVLKMFLFGIPAVLIAQVWNYFTNKQNSMDKLICFVHKWLGDYHICIFNLDN